MSNRVGIVGAGVTPFKGTWREKTYYELAQMAARASDGDLPRAGRRQEEIVGRVLQPADRGKPNHRPALKRRAEKSQGR